MALIRQGEPFFSSRKVNDWSLLAVWKEAVGEPSEHAFVSCFIGRIVNVAA